MSCVRKSKIYYSTSTHLHMLIGFSSLLENIIMNIIVEVF